MSSSGSRPVSWVNIPITRTVSTIMASVVEELQQQQQQGPKRVRWSEELTQVRDISPRYKAAPFRFQSPSRRASSSLTSSSSYSSPPRSSLTSSHLHCSPQLQKVVFRAVTITTWRATATAPATGEVVDTAAAGDRTEPTCPSTSGPPRSDVTQSFNAEQNNKCIKCYLSIIYMCNK